MGNVKVFLFDAAGVLYEKNLAVGEALEAELGISLDSQAYVWGDLYREISTGKITEDNYFSKLAEKYNQDERKLREVFTTSFERSFKPMQGMDELLVELKGKGYRLAVLSDTSTIFDAIRRKFDIYKHFEKVFLSYEAGYLKPSPQIYKVAMDYFRLEPDNFFFIDDQEKNTDAARRLGMQAVVFESTEKLRNDIAKLG